MSVHIRPGFYSWGAPQHPSATTSLPKPVPVELYDRNRLTSSYNKRTPAPEVGPQPIFPYNDKYGWVTANQRLPQPAKNIDNDWFVKKIDVKHTPAPRPMTDKIRLQHFKAMIASAESAPENENFDYAEILQSLSDVKALRDDLLPMYRAYMLLLQIAKTRSLNADEKQQKEDIEKYVRTLLADQDVMKDVVALTSSPDEAIDEVKTSVDNVSIGISTLEQTINSGFAGLANNLAQNAPTMFAQPQPTAQLPVPPLVNPNTGELKMDDKVVIDHWVASSAVNLTQWRAKAAQKGLNASNMSKKDVVEWMYKKDASIRAAMDSMDVDQMKPLFSAKKQKSKK